MSDTEDSDLEEGVDIVRHKTKIVSKIQSHLYTILIVSEQQIVSSLLIQWLFWTHMIMGQSWWLFSLRSIRTSSRLFTWSRLVSVCETVCDWWSALQMFQLCVLNHRCHLWAVDEDKAGGEEASGSSDARVCVLVAHPPPTAGESPHHLLGRGDGLPGLQVSVLEERSDSDVPVRSWSFIALFCLSVCQMIWVWRGWRRSRSWKASWRPWRKEYVSVLMKLTLLRWFSGSDHVSCFVQLSNRDMERKARAVVSLSRLFTTVCRCDAAVSLLKGCSIREWIYSRSCRPRLVFMTDFLQINTGRFIGQ